MSFLTAIAPALVSAGGGVLGGLFGRQDKQTPIQKKQQQLVDQLMASLNGKGPYSNLFSVDEEAFNKGFREPAMAQFRNQTAPQIQQAYIASGQQRGTGMEDALTRAGVDMDQMINQQYAMQQQQAQQNKLNAMSGILGQNPGAAPTPSPWEAAMQGFSGALTTPAFGEAVKGFFQSPYSLGTQQTQTRQREPFTPYTRSAEMNAILNQPLTKGFENNQNPYYSQGAIS